MIEIHYMVLVGVSSFIIGLGVLIWALRDALSQEERTVSKLANDCTIARSEIRNLREELEMTDMYNEHVEGQLRESLDHIELAKLERDEVSDDFEQLDEIATATVNSLKRRLETSELNLYYASLQRDTWARIYGELHDLRADELELVKLERDEARDDRDDALLALELDTIPVSIRSAVAPKRKRLAS